LSGSPLWRALLFLGGICVWCTIRMMNYNDFQTIFAFSLVGHC
jgi:hypothetical protein